MAMRKEHSDYGEFHRQLGYMYNEFELHPKLRLCRSDLDVCRFPPKRTTVYSSLVHKAACRDLKAFRCHARDLFMDWLPSIGTCNLMGLWPVLQKQVARFSVDVGKLFWGMNKRKVKPKYDWPTDRQIASILAVMFGDIVMQVKENV
jgi:hypothetical protein